VSSFVRVPKRNGQKSKCFFPSAVGEIRNRLEELTGICSSPTIAAPTSEGPRSQGLRRRCPPGKSNCDDDEKVAFEEGDATNSSAAAADPLEALRNTYKTYFGGKLMQFLYSR
jgi:hypothetical protein